MNREQLDERAATARAAIAAAGDLAASYYRRRHELAVESKGVQDLVSEADRACEQLIVARLARDFPHDSILGEEGGLQQRGPAIWIIDPIDGTSNFLRGISHWCVSIGLALGAKPLLGMIFDPIAGELFAAVDGSGATLNGTPIRVSGETRIGHARISVGFSYRRTVKPHAADIAALLEAKCEYLRLGSGALGMAYTAAGRLDGYWERHINSWDVAAGLSIVQEAGGRTNDFLAGDGLMIGGEILAATPALFEPLMNLLGHEDSGMDDEVSVEGSPVTSAD